MLVDRTTVLFLCLLITHQELYVCTGACIGKLYNEQSKGEVSCECEDQL